MKYLLVLMIILCSVILYATEQIPDVLILEGKTFYIKGFGSVFPLESFFEGKERPSFRQTNDHRRGLSTGCHRGYVATWIVEKKKLKLLSISTFVNGKQMSSEEIIGKNNFAKWYSGTIKLSDSIYPSGYIKTLEFKKGILHTSSEKK
jgi:hypothetical protein